MELAVQESEWLSVHKKLKLTELLVIDRKLRRMYGLPEFFLFRRKVWTAVKYMISLLKIHYGYFSWVGIF